MDASSRSFRYSTRSTTKKARSVKERHALTKQQKRKEMKEYIVSLADLDMSSYKKLGEGQYGKVYDLLDGTIIKLAIDDKPNAISECMHMHEIELTKKWVDPSLKYDYIVKGDKIYTYMAMKKLNKINKEMSVENLVAIIEYVFIQLQDLSKHGIIHGDPKLDNIMMSFDKPSLIDYGLAVPMDPVYYIGYLHQYLWFIITLCVNLKETFGTTWKKHKTSFLVVFNSWLDQLRFKVDTLNISEEDKKHMTATYDKFQTELNELPFFHIKNLWNIEDPLLNEFNEVIKPISDLEYYYLECYDEITPDALLYADSLINKLDSVPDAHRREMYLNKINYLIELIRA